MAHYAFLDENNIVTEVIVGKDEGNFDWEQYYGNFRTQACKRTSFNTRGGIHYDPQTGEPSEDQSKSFRKNYAGIGYKYDAEKDAFICPQPYPSWVLSPTSCLWKPPVAMPEDGKQYSWDENSLNWIEQ
jgi:hypothetical protein